VNVDAEKLTGRLEAVDILGGDQAAIVEAIATYLEEDAEVSEEDASEVLVQGQQLLGTVLPSLGIEVKQSVDGVDGVEELPEVPTVKETTVIKDVRAYKASMNLTQGRRPVTSLSEFEDIEPKL